jgi:hypothetical protein
MPSAISAIAGSVRFGVPGAPVGFPRSHPETLARHGKHA